MSVDSASQLPLALKPDAGPRFSTYVAGGNAEAFDAVQALVAGGGPEQIYLWGARGTGKSHLLQAACRETGAGDLASAYVPLRRRAALTPEVLSSLEELDLVCIDDVGAVAGGLAWEEQLFHLYNRAQTIGARLLVAGSARPGDLGFSLPDLASRLSALLNLRLVEPDDDVRVEILLRHARQRGFTLSGDVLAYLMRREPRDLHHLMQVLDVIDLASLSSARAVTVPLLRSVLYGERPPRR